MTYAALPVDWDKMSPAVSAEFYMDLVKTLAAAEARAEEAENKLDPKHPSCLAGYRELGETCARIENAHDDTRRALARCRGLLGECKGRLPVEWGGVETLKARIDAELEKAP